MKTQTQEARMPFFRITLTDHRILVARARNKELLQGSPNLNLRQVVEISEAEANTLITAGVFGVVHHNGHLF